MATLSFAEGVDATYDVVAGVATVMIASGSKLNHRAAYVGTGEMQFHRVENAGGGGSRWQCAVVMDDPAPVVPKETVGEDGSQKLEVAMENVFPAGFLLRMMNEGTLVAPAVHVDVPLGGDVWVFLIRSPWFPMTLQVDRSSLSVEHDVGKATVAFSPTPDGSLTSVVSLDGKGFKKASLGVRRTIGAYSSDEIISEVGTGVQDVTWKPIMKNFDLVLVAKGTITERQLVELVKGLGGQVESNILGGPGIVKNNFVLCDGPAFSYSWFLKGHIGFLKNVEDQTSARFTW